METKAKTQPLRREHASRLHTDEISATTSEIPDRGFAVAEGAGAAMVHRRSAKVRKRRRGKFHVPSAAHPCARSSGLPKLHCPRLSRPLIGCSNRQPSPMEPPARRRNSSKNRVSSRNAQNEHQVIGSGLANRSPTLDTWYNSVIDIQAAKEPCFLESRAHAKPRSSCTCAGCKPDRPRFTPSNAALAHI